jgi:C-terminal processing protease CtpA/Prc
MATDQDKESNHYEDQDCSPETLIKHPLQVLVSYRDSSAKEILPRMAMNYSKFREPILKF